MNKIAIVGVAAALATALSGPALAKHIKEHRHMVRVRVPADRDHGFQTIVITHSRAS